MGGAVALVATPLLGGSAISVCVGWWWWWGRNTSLTRSGLGVLEGQNCWHLGAVFEVVRQ